MGNDQVRFDLTVKSLGDYNIIAPIREIQQQHDNVRVYEKAYLEERGFKTPPKYSSYTINENLLGVTISSSEIDEWKEPGPETYQLTAHPKDWPSEPTRAAITFEEGVATMLDGESIEGPELIQVLNKRFCAYGICRGMYAGDTTI